MRLDSTILIDYFSRVKKAHDFLCARGIFLSVITRAKLLVGVRDGEFSEKAKKVINLFPTLQITPDDADLAAELRRIEKWKLPDAFQAAIAKKHGLKLVTRNTTDFPAHQYKFVKVPYQL